jgi:hypothetical protein
MLITYEAALEHGKFRWIDPAPSVETAQLWVTLQPPSTASSQCGSDAVVRKPHPAIAGNLIINGDIFDSVPASDWHFSA